MVDRSIAVRLRAEVSDFKAKMADAAKSARDAQKQVGEAVGKNRDSLDRLATQAGAMGLAMVAAAGLAVTSFAAFDKAMSSVQAATHESAQNMGLLRDAALDAGARTQYSATEAAGAVENLAKAGVSTADILGGGLDGALDLAAAGAMDVAAAAEAAASAMTQFNLDGGDTAHVADLLAAGAGKAQGEVSDLSMALNQSGLVANQMGLSVEETIGTLTAFAKAGLLGSDAGTSFRAMLLRLANPTGEAAQVMEDLGIQVYDAGGQFIGMEGLAGQLAGKLGGLTQETRNAALATIFGQDAIRAASILYENGAQGIAEWTSAVDDSGYAAETARIRMDNLSGDLEKLRGALDTAFIQGGSGANDVLRQMAQGAASLVTEIGKLPSPLLSATTLLVGAGGLATLGVAGVGKLVVQISEAKAAMQALNISTKTAGIAAGGLGAALGIATVALSVWATNAAEAKARTEELQSTLDEFGNTTDDTLRSINEDLARDRNGWLDNLFGEDPRRLIDLGEQIGLTVSDLQGYILGEAEAVERVNAAMDDYTKNARGQDATERAFAVRDVTRWLDAEAQALTDGQKAQALKARADEEAGVASDDLSDTYQNTTDAITDQTDAIKDLIDAQREASGAVLSVRDAQRQFEQSTDDATAALEENGATLDISTEAGRRNQAALDDITQSGWDLIDSMSANGATQEQLQGTMATTRQRFVEAAIAFGMGADEANRLADEMGLIPTNVATKVTVDTNEAFAAIRALRDEASRVIQMRVNANPSYSPANTVNTIARAGGGPVYGPGTSTSDSIPARLSNGEYVVKAAAVGHYGRQVLDSINSMRFATGGFVGGPGVGGRELAGVAAGMTFGDVTLVAADPQGLLAELRSELGFAMATSGVRRG